MLVRSPAARLVSKPVTRPAPIKGIDALDGLVAMPEGFAVILRNMYAQPYGCQVRRGFVQHATGLGGPVETLASHNKADGTKSLYAFTNVGSNSCNITDITLPNQDNPTAKATVAGNARWQHINFANAAGVHLIAVNGASDMLWVKSDNSFNWVTSGSGSGNTIANVDPKKFIHVTTHQKRLWFVEKDSTRGWYMPPDQITGQATSFDFGGLWNKGGYLVQLATWTLDDGDGADDHLIAISSEGQVAVYAGTDPATSGAWGLKGVYYCGAPVGRRCAVKYGGDIIIMTEFGLVLMSTLLKSTKVNPTEAEFARPIQSLLSKAGTAFADIFGWQPFIFPGANMVMINVPAADNTHYQFVMNDITNAWSELIGYDANCWEIHDMMPIFGGNGRVDRGWERYTDKAIVANDGTVTEGLDIMSEAQTAYSYFNAFGQQKHFKMVNPYIVSSGVFAMNLAVNVDFNFDAINSPSTFPATAGGIWDQGKWDQVSWAWGLTTHHRWISVTGLGVAGSLRIRLLTRDETYWASTDWLYEIGGIL